MNLSSKPFPTPPECAPNAEFTTPLRELLFMQKLTQPSNNMLILMLIFICLFYITPPVAYPLPGWVGL